MENSMHTGDWVFYIKRLILTLIKQTMSKKEYAFLGGVAIDMEWSAYIMGFGPEYRFKVLTVCKPEGQDIRRWTDMTPDKKPVFKPYKSVTSIKTPSRAVVAISQEGYVRVIDSNFHVYEEQIPTTSVLTNVVAISGKAFAIGGNREIWRRDNVNEWTLLTPPPSDSSNDIYFSIDGFSENDFYVGSSGGEIWHYQEGTWSQLETLARNIITSLCCTDTGKVYACGQSAMILEYENDKGKVIEWLDENHPGINLNRAYGDIWSVAWYQGKLFLSGYAGIFTLEGTHLEPVDMGEDHPETTYQLSAYQNTLLSIGENDILTFNGEHWTRID
jgi:hypothetical protein